MDGSLHHKKLSFKKLKLSSNSLFHCWIGALKLSLLLKLYPIKLDLDSNYIISSSEVELYLCKSTIQCYQCYNVTCLCWFSYVLDFLCWFSCICFSDVLEKLQGMDKNTLAHVRDISHHFYLSSSRLVVNSTLDRTF